MTAGVGFFVSHTIARGVFDYAVARGADARALCAVSGTSPDNLRDPAGRMPLGNFHTLYEHVARTFDDPAVPVHVVQRRRLEDLHVLGFAVMSSATARAAIESALRFQSLISNAAQWSMIEEGRRVCVKYANLAEDRLGRRLSIESAVCMFAHSLRQIHGGDVAIERVGFRHGAPREVRAHETFFGSAVEFGADYNGFSFPRHLLDAVKPPLANPELRAFFESQAAELLGSVPPADPVSQTRAAIDTELGAGEPTMTSVARRLGTSERSLRRQLKEHGVTFRDLVENVRKEHAARLLRRPALTLSEVAARLGFSEISAFSRAFKRWFGTTPGAFRSAT